MKYLPMSFIMGMVMVDHPRTLILWSVCRVSWDSSLYRLYDSI